MPVLETLATLLGPTIARCILRGWLDDGDIAEELTSSISSIVKAKTNDFLAQRRAERQFESIGERIAVQLLPLFNEQEEHINEERQKIIVQSVARTLKSGVITANMLAKINLEPFRLKKYLEQYSPNITKDFSEIESQLYNRILHECSNYIIDTASQLPSFTEKTLALILKREDQLIGIVEQILKEVQQIQASTDRWGTGVNTKWLETEYHRAVVRKLNKMELFGAEVSSSSREHSLNVAYVTLSVGQHWDVKTTDHLLVDDILSNSRKLLIRGLAGAGKTTLLKWVAVQTASRNFSGELKEWNKLVPFFIRLRHFIDKPLPRPSEFPSDISPELMDVIRRDWVHKQLSLGRAIVLIDGIDEVPLKKREEVRTWIEGLTNTFPLSRFIVTSRPSAIAEGWLVGQNFTDAYLQPMGLQDIYKFVDQWHDAVSLEIVDREEKKRLIKLAKNLKKKLKNDKNSIRNLARTPLLCAIICALHRERREQLPKDRTELYEDCSRMLLELRDRDRKIKSHDYPNMNYSLKKQLIQGFSYWMIDNGWTEASISDVDNYFNTQLARMGNRLQNSTAYDVRRYFVERSGILRLISSDHITFTHRTFQEYYSAQEALDMSNLGVLIQRADDDQWREVILLAAGLAKPHQAEELIEGIINQGNTLLATFSEEKKLRQRKLHVLAAICANVAVSITPNLMAKIKSNLRKLLPPKDVEELESLAEAHSILLPLLKAKPTYSESESVIYIRLLTKIGGNKAFNVLRTYSNDSRKKVIWQLLQTWNSFDDKLYAKYILQSSKLNEMEHLHFSYVSQAMKAKRFFELNELCKLGLTYCNSNSELAELVRIYPNIVNLLIYNGNGISTLSNLTKIPNLKSLYLKNFTSLTNFESLIGSQHLESLYLTNYKPTTTLLPLMKLNSLKYLYINSSEARGLRYILEEHKTLTHVTVIGMPKKILANLKTNVQIEHKSK